MTHLTDADLDRIENELAGFRNNAGIPGFTYSAWYDEQITALVAEVRRLRAHTTTTLVACSRCDRGIPPRYAVDGRLCPECAGDELWIISQYLDANSDVPWVQHCLRRLAGDDATEGDYRRARGVAPAPEDSPLPEERIRRLREDGYIRN